MSLVTNTIASTTLRSDNRVAERPTGKTFSGLFADMDPLAPPATKPLLPGARAAAKKPPLPPIANSAPGQWKPISPVHAGIDPKVPGETKLRTAQSDAPPSKASPTNSIPHADTAPSNGAPARLPIAKQDQAAKDGVSTGNPQPDAIRATDTEPTAPVIAGTEPSPPPPTFKIAAPPLPSLPGSRKALPTGFEEVGAGAENSADGPTVAPPAIPVTPMIAALPTPKPEAGQPIIPRLSRAKLPTGAADAAPTPTIGSALPSAIAARDGVPPSARLPLAGPQPIALDDPATAWAPELARVIAPLGQADAPSRTARLKLHPEALGEIDISVELRQDRVSATLVMSSPSAHALVAAASDTLERAIAAAGLSLDQLHLASGNGGGRSSAGHAGHDPTPAPHPETIAAGTPRPAPLASCGSAPVGRLTTGHMGAVDVHA